MGDGINDFHGKKITLLVGLGIRQDSYLSNVNKSQSQNECIGIISGSLYTQENRWGIEECIGENNEKRGVKEDCQLRMRNLSQESNELSLPR
jgi:hypothetical protein